MNIVFKCEFCQTEMQASEDAVGKQCFCVSCGMRTIIGKEAPAPAAPEPANVATRSASDPKLLSIDCPTCTQKLDYAQALIGTKGLCRHCHELFMLPKAGQPAVVMKRRPNYIAFQCNTCLQLFEGSTSQVGLKGRCTNCSSVFTIEALEPKPPTAAPPTAPSPQSSHRDTVQPPELELAPEPQPQSTLTPDRPPSPAQPQQSHAPSSIAKPSRPAANLKARPQPSSPSIQVEVVAEPQSSNVPWSDMGNLGPISTFPSLSDPYYASPSATYSAPRKRVSVGELFSSTMDCLFPAAFVIAVPSLAIVLVNGLGIGALYGLGYLVSQLPKDDVYMWYLRLAIGIVSLTIMVCTPFTGVIAFFPLQFKLANIAAKGKEVDTTMMHMSMPKRMSIVGYCIVQPLLLTPLYFLVALPTVVLIVLAPASFLFGFMAFFSMLFSFYATYVLYSMFAIGACAVADNRGVGEAISISFRSLFQYPLALLSICAMEIIPITVLGVTMLGFIFVGFPYVLIRSARFYQMTNK